MIRTKDRCSRHVCAAVIALALLLIACDSSAGISATARMPGYCVAPQGDALQDVAGTPSGPYFVHHPAPQTSHAPTVIFLPGGSGLRRNAQRVWDSFLSGAKDVDAFRVVVPYWPDIEIPEDFRRTVAVVDEVVACYGADARTIHLAGFSNGGHAAFELMLEQPQRFKTLLGVPGEFPPGTTARDLAVLRGRAVFNGIGQLDDAFWHQGVRDAHELLLAAGVDSVYVEFVGQGHGAGPGFPKDQLFAFWMTHSTH